MLGGYTTIPKQAHILSLAVLEIYRGKGYGRMILEHFLGSIRRLGYNNVKLEVNVSKSKAIKLYEEFGFRIESKIRKYYQDDSDAYLMIKRDTPNNQIL